MKEKTLNLDPYHCEIRRYEGGFTWTFYGVPENGHTKQKINIKFERWWLVYLSKDLKKVLKKEKEEMELLERLFFSDDN